ncbi:FAD-binding protein [Microbispora sp. NPDC049125]|uniref:FAD-binding protein n=1 Tax=Microbispora sp. NPDC049125 TaxID=3154929 RepID=UPI0034679EB8
MPVRGRRPLAIAVLVKQVPRFDALRLTARGRLDRESAPPEINPYCRRAVAKGIELARSTGGVCTVFTLGPPSAEDCLREAVACGADLGVLVSDPGFAGSDTIATARVLTAALRERGPFDLVLCGRSSVDADTAQTPAQLAELLELPMAASVLRMALTGDTVTVHCQHDDGWSAVELTLPALLTCAERLTAPAKAGPAERAAVPAGRVVTLDAAALRLGPGEAASRTTVGRVRHLPSGRARVRFSGDVEDQVARAVAMLAALGAFDRSKPAPAREVPVRSADARGAAVAVLAEPGRDRATRELLGEAARLARLRGGHVTALTPGFLEPQEAGAWGADHLVVLEPGNGLQEAAATATAFAHWCAEHRPWAVLAPSTSWGREVAGRMAVRLDAGLVADAVGLDAVGLDAGGGSGLVCWKSAFSGGSVAEIGYASPIKMATLRPGVLPLMAPRTALCGVSTLQPITTAVHRRVRTLERGRDDELDALTTAEVVVAVGAGVDVGDYPMVRPLLDALGAELAATRKVTDRGWQPRGRQIGITGRSVAPRLLVSVGASGKYNHLSGTRGARLVLAVNDDPGAPVFHGADVGVVADWREALPPLTAAVLARTRASARAPRPDALVGGTR